MKRGQSAAGAGILLAIIAFLLIMFIIVIPPADRAELLGENTTSGSSMTPDSTIPEKIFLSVSPGRIDYYDERDVEHPLPVTTIKTTVEPEVIAQKPTSYLKRGIFSEREDTFNFNLPDLNKVGPVLFSYSIQDIQGELIVILNNQEIFQGLPKSPLELPKNILLPQNVLKIKVSSPGLAFWQTNHVSLNALQIVAQITDTKTQSARHVFLISETEKKNMDSVRVKFQANCQMGQVGKLRIAVNGQEIYDALPDCDITSIPLEFSPQLLRQGENDITFFTDKGVYVLSHINIFSKLKRIEYPTYYFEVTQEEFNEVDLNKKRIRLQLHFVDTISRKTGEILFNGYKRHIDTKEGEYVIDLSEELVKGTNSVQIRPQRTLQIRELKVDFLKK